MWIFQGKQSLGFSYKLPKISILPGLWAIAQSDLDYTFFYLSTTNVKKCFKYECLFKDISCFLKSV